MYNVHQSEQTVIFLTSLGVGFLLGILYDVFRAIRLSLTKSRTATIIFDILYFFTFGFLSYIFILALNKGEIRSYIIIGEIIGAVFYYFSFGIVAIRLTDKFVAIINRIKKFIFTVISFPLKLLHRLFYKSILKIKEIFKKTEKKSSKMQKRVLPKLRLYVYNLLGILGVGRASSKKGGSNFGNEQK